MAKRRKTVRVKGEDLPPPDPKELEELDRMDREGVPIDYSDIPPTTPGRLAVARQLAEGKTQPISLRVDEAVLKWFRDQGPGYQTRMRQVLRDHMLGQVAGEPEQEEVELVPTQGRSRKPKRYLMRRVRK